MELENAKIGIFEQNNMDGYHLKFLLYNEQSNTHIVGSLETLRTRAHLYLIYNSVGIVNLQMNKMKKSFFPEWLII